MADAIGLAEGADVDIEAAFRDVDADEQGCSMTRPCECGLCRPKRLFGFDDGTVGGAPGSRTVFSDPEEDGLPPTFTRPSLVLGWLREIQEDGAMLEHRTSSGSRR